MTDGTSSSEGRFSVKVAAETHFAWLRTRLSVERTMLAWVRTAVSLIAFGFTIVQFFERMQEIPAASPLRFPTGPRYLGLALIFCGVASLAICMWEYRWTLRYLWSLEYAAIAGLTPKGRNSPAIAVAGLLMLVGIFAFTVVLLRLV